MIVFRAGRRCGSRPPPTSTLGLGLGLTLIPTLGLTAIRAVILGAVAALALATGGAEARTLPTATDPGVSPPAPAPVDTAVPAVFAGAWCLVRLEVNHDPLGRYQGWLTITLGDGARPTGQLYLTKLDDDSYALQDLALQGLGDGRVRAQGTLVQSQNWVADTLTMRIDPQAGQDVLTGDGIDINLTEFSYQFHRGHRDSCRPTVS